MKKKICKQCKIFVDEAECPICKGAQFNTTWQGRVNVIDAERSVIGRKMGFSKSGEYAIKTR